jgi:mannose-6-phosphate isomerase
VNPEADEPDGSAAPADGQPGVPDREHSVRPWGSYTVLDKGPGFWVKRIEVLPDHRLSLQRHEHRTEHWVVVRGTGTVVLDGLEIDVGVGDRVEIPLGAAHRARNRGSELLVFVEVAHGDYVGEDDIVRLEDDYGRAPGD